MSDTQPLDIDRAAPVVVDLSITADAPPATVWRVLTDIDRWPDWNPDIDSARIDGPAAVGTSFRWSTAGLDITSTIGHVDTGKRIAWGGDTSGIFGIHVWTLQPGDPAGATTVLRTVESWSGDAVDADPAPLKAVLEASLNSWLDRLRSRAEQTKEVKP